LLSKVLKEDIDYIINDRVIDWNRFKNSTLVITGATGLIGTILVRTLSEANSKYNLNARIIIIARGARKGNVLADQCGAIFVQHDICLPLQIQGSADYIFHCASITKSSDMLQKPVDVIETCYLGTKNILDFAKAKNVKSLVNLSSMEVYGTTENMKNLGEADLGYVDLSNPRNSYPEAKRLCENLCTGYFTQYNVPVKTARLCRTFGAGMENDPGDNRVACQFVRKAIANEDIVLHTKGKSISNCCYTADVIKGLLVILQKGENGQSYNIANTEASGSIYKMAEIIADRICGGRIKVVIDPPKDLKSMGYAPDTLSVINSDKLQKLGWEPRFGLEDMLKRIILDWQEIL